MERELATRAMRPTRADAGDQVGQPDATPDRAVEPEWHVLPAVGAERAVAHRPVEPIRVAEDQRPGRPVDLEMRCLARDDVE